MVRRHAAAENRRRARPSKSAPGRHARPPPTPAAPEFAGAAIKADVETIVGFARAARRAQGNRQRPDVGTHLRLPVERHARSTGPSTSSARPASPTSRRSRSRRTRSRRCGCRCRGRSRCLATRRSDLARTTSCSNPRCRCRLRRFQGGTHDGAARLRRRGQSRRAPAHRRQGQDRRAADRAAGPHAVRARRGRFARRRAGEARRHRRLQPGPPARQRAVARLQQLRQSLLQHRRPRRALPGVGARSRRAGRRGGQGSRAHRSADADVSRPEGDQRRRR